MIMKKIIDVSLTIVVVGTVLSYVGIGTFTRKPRKKPTRLTDF